MKKFIVIIVLLILIVGFFIIKPDITQNQAQSPITLPDEQTQEESREETPLGNPQTLTIEKLGINAEIESVGMDEKGNMDVPQEDMNVAWYNLGYKPGDNGSAVLAGHFDTKSGGPAVFYELSQLTEGDEISVEYDDGTSFTFTVTEQELYNFDSVPLERIFNTSGTPQLNLITCDGVFDSSERNYSQRRVVYAQLLE